MRYIVKDWDWSIGDTPEESMHRAMTHLFASGSRALGSECAVYAPGEVTGGVYGVVRYVGDDNKRYEAPIYALDEAEKEI